MPLMCKRGAVLALALALTGCPGFGDKTLEELVGMPQQTPTWDDDIQQLLSNRCAVCHTSPPVGGAPDSFRLDKYATDELDGMLPGALDMRDRIVARAVDKNPGPMPPSDDLSDQERLLIDLWVMAGAPKSRSDVQ